MSQYGYEQTPEGYGEPPVRSSQHAYPAQDPAGAPPAYPVYEESPTQVTSPPAYGGRHSPGAEQALAGQHHQAGPGHADQRSHASSIATAGQPSYGAGPAYETQPSYGASLTVPAGQPSYGAGPAYEAQPSHGAGPAYEAQPSHGAEQAAVRQPYPVEAQSPGGEVVALAGQFAQRFGLLAGNIEKIIRGKREVVELALVCLLSEGHLLIEDVPGTGKSTLARAIAGSVDAQWRRIRFTPDLLPSDITGAPVFDQTLQRPEFRRGPVFANIVLADEIDQASPKTRSALLEVMEERRVTVDAEEHPLLRPFLVVATHNPVDTDGPRPLPTAQLDRFLMRISVGYPDHACEVEVLKGMPAGPQVERLPVVARASDVAGMIDFATRIHVADPIYEYVVAIVAATRVSPEVRLGASPRASLALIRAAKVRAAATGRHYVVPEDVDALAVPVLAHRLIMTAEAGLRGRTGAALVGDIVVGTRVPQALAGM
ncbi:AAA family ATPase [Streptosporangium sp. CA-135522]|uniref:AAA family ATPase n=1 Tax=Streptosporangium sp. CA-135522 TaxID=3240072 RepID=UPI003D8A47C3